MPTKRYDASLRALDLEVCNQLKKLHVAKGAVIKPCERQLELDRQIKHLNKQIVEYNKKAVEFHSKSGTGSKSAGAGQGARSADSKE